MKQIRSLLPLLVLLSSSAAAQGKLETKVFTGSPAGFGATSTLVCGAKDAILVDAQFDQASAHRLVAFLLESGKNLTTVYVTHAHPDHHFGLGVVRQAFPRAKLVAVPATIDGIKKTGRAKIAEWKPLYGANLTSEVVLPEPLKGKTLTLEGETLEIVGPVQGDDFPDTYVWIPSTRTVITGDLVFSGVYPWTAETDAKSRKAWIAAVDEIAARNPAVVIPGHQRPEMKPDTASLAFVRGYLADFDVALAASKGPEELKAKVRTKYPDLGLEPILDVGAAAAFKPHGK